MNDVRRREHLLPHLQERAAGHCELCSAEHAAHVWVVGPVDTAALEQDALGATRRAVLLCAECERATEDPVGAGPHLRCLQASAWSEVAAVQVATYRLLTTLQGAGETWASDLLTQMYLDDDTLAWAQAEHSPSPTGDALKTVDANGTALVDGDSVTLVKDLDVKGAGFTAKRGTLVKNIRLTEDPELVDARVNKIAIVLKTCFLKKA